MYSWLWKRGEPRAVDEYDAQIFPTLGKRMCKGSFEITQTKVWQNKGELDNLIFFFYPGVALPTLGKK